MMVESSITGKFWLDRNIGAEFACNDSSSTNCYGEYFQVGRLADGHVKPNSGVSNSTIEVYGTASSDEFITVLNDWGTGDVGGGSRESMWNNSTGVSVCPDGYNIPTVNDLVAEEMGNPEGLFYDNVPKSGYRDPGGAVSYAGSLQILWSRQHAVGAAWASSVSNSSADQHKFPTSRAYGINIRCRKL
jgi:hypothetical protein